MTKTNGLAARVSALAAFGLSVFAFGGAQAATCVGSCGFSAGPDGVVTSPPGGAGFSWISTDGGVNGAGQLPGVGGSNGSSFTTDTFAATAGQKLEYYFNYITSDGAGYADYAWVQLLDAADTVIAILLTARTHPTDSIIPGFDLPPIDATLTPPSVPIIGGGPAWSPLGGSSGSCFNVGCGYTGWVLSEYTIAAAGVYKLMFGVTNWSDSQYDSGLAFSGIKIDGKPVGEIPLPAALPLFLAGAGALAALRRRKRRA